MVLPDANKGDLFFDFEGDPLWTADGREWGLEYLWGVLTVADGFHPFWAHDRASERQALIDFLAMVRKRLRRYAGMHIYHYAAYEKSTLLRLAGRYGVGENDVDDMLRHGLPRGLFSLGPQGNWGRRGKQPKQAPRAAVHGQRASHRRGDPRHRFHHGIRALLRATR